MPDLEKLDMNLHCRENLKQHNEVDSILN